MMQAVIEATQAVETRGKMVNGRLVTAQLWQVWVCKLACGHMAKRRNDSLTPPERLKCKVCPAA